MHTTADQLSQEAPVYHGLRMTAAAYLELGETRHRYELIDGVVLMSPSASALHQRIIARLSAKIIAFLETSPIGEVYVESDVWFGAGPTGGDIVYRPDIVFLSASKAANVTHRIDVTPDVVIEVVSPSSIRLDQETKKNDYERFGVPEYWIVNPLTSEFSFYVLENEKYVERGVSGDAYASEVIEGFTLDLAAARKLFG